MQTDEPEATALLSAEAIVDAVLRAIGREVMERTPTDNTYLQAIRLQMAHDRLDAIQAVKAILDEEGIAHAP